MSTWAGWLVDPETPLLLVLENEGELDEVIRLFLRTGYSKFAGYLVGGMKAWNDAGMELSELGQLTVHELNTKLDDYQIVDVRSPDEWEEGHVPGTAIYFCRNLRRA